MTDKDTHLLSETYSLMLEKVLTPAQIAKKAQPAGSAGKSGDKLPKNNTEDKAVEKTLKKVPYTDQHPENFNKDGVDTEVKDRYVVKEGISDTNKVTDFMDRLKEVTHRLLGLIPTDGAGIDEDFLTKLDIATDILADLTEIVDRPPANEVAGTTSVPAPEGVANSM